MMQLSIQNVSMDVLAIHTEASDVKQEGSLQDNTDSMHANFVYKRRKMRNSVALLSEDSHMRGMKEVNASNSSQTSGCFSLKENDLHFQGILALPKTSTNYILSHPHKSSVFFHSQPDDTRYLEFPLNRTGEEPQQLVDKVYQLSPDARDSCSSSKSNMAEGSSSTNTEMGDADVCSLSPMLVVKQLAECGSSRNACTSPCASHGQCGDHPSNSTCSSVNELFGNDTSSLACKVCGCTDNQLNMLICDLCEEAFHLCCSKVKRLPVDEWYCQTCLRMKPNLLLETLSGKLFTIMSEKKKRKLLLEKLGPILYMLKDTSPYTSRVRIGQYFQADVPEWTGPVTNDVDYFNETLELGPTECYNLNGWRLKSSRPSSIGNWLQCRAMNEEEGISCGKWRRAPLFVSQTEDWDCSCALPWDPIHADCAVPQELDTNEVLKQLKYIELLKPRLTRKR